MAAEFNNPGDQPHIPQFYRSYEAVFPADSTEIQEPPVLSVFDQCPEATSHEEGVIAAAKLEDILQGNFEKFSDFVNVGPGPTSRGLQLERATDEGLVFLRLRSDDENGKKLREIDILNNEPSGTSREYYIVPTGELRRHDYDLDLVDLGMPLDGEKSMETSSKLRETAHEEDLKNREVAAQLGFPDKAVGTNEISRVAQLIEEAEPEIVPYSYLSSINDQRMRSDDKTSLPDALEAGMRFTGDMQNYLRREGADPSGSAVIRKDVMDPRAFLRVTAGQTVNEDTSTPHVHLHYALNRKEGRYNEEIYYTVRNGIFVNRTKVYLERDGRRRMLADKTQDADIIESMAVRDFLRNPMVTRPAVNEQQTDQ
ncbi:MAG TPA: hypothetical protein VHT70_01110 [Candidatus Saccharimonadales bacterium]|jgi:hypothetical protein|nr:hypothetical protein [Candidatus Saccharimonadales bacterium]